MSTKPGAIVDFVPTSTIDEAKDLLDAFKKDGGAGQENYDEVLKQVITDNLVNSGIQFTPNIQSLFEDKFSKLFIDNIYTFQKMKQELQIDHEIDRLLNIIFHPTGYSTPNLSKNTRTRIYNYLQRENRVHFPKETMVVINDPYLMDFLSTIINFPPNAESNTIKVQSNRILKFDLPASDLNLTYGDQQKSNPGTIGQTGLSFHIIDAISGLNCTGRRCIYTPQLSNDGQPISRLVKFGYQVSEVHSSSQESYTVSASMEIAIIDPPVNIVFAKPNSRTRFSFQPEGTDRFYSDNSSNFGPTDLPNFDQEKTFETENGTITRYGTSRDRYFFEYTPNQGFTGTDKFPYKIVPAGSNSIIEHGIVYIEVQTPSYTKIDDDQEDDQFFIHNTSTSSHIVLNKNHGSGLFGTPYTSEDIANDSVLKYWDGPLKIFTHHEDPSSGIFYGISKTFTAQNRNDPTQLSFDSEDARWDGMDFDIVLDPLSWQYLNDFGDIGTNFPYALARWLPREGSYRPMFGFIYDAYGGGFEIDFITESVLPVSSDDSFFVTEDFPSKFRLNAHAFNNNNYSGRGWRTAYPVIVSPPEHGQVTCSEYVFEYRYQTQGYLGPECTYIPDPDFFGNDSFSYKVVDPLGLESKISTIELSIFSEDDLPGELDISLATSYDVPISFELPLKDRDGEDLSYNFPPGQFGSVSCQSNICTYTPSSNQEGEETIDFTVSDGWGISQSKITIKLLDSNSPEIRIVEGKKENILDPNEQTSYRVRVLDAEDGDLSGTLQWYDGENLIHTGPTYSFSASTNKILTLKSKDSHGHQVEETIEVWVKNSCDSLPHGDFITRIMYKESSSMACESQEQRAYCSFGSMESFSGNFDHNECIDLSGSCGEIPNGGTTNRKRGGCASKLRKNAVEAR